MHHATRQDGVRWDRSTGEEGMRPGRDRGVPGGRASEANGSGRQPRVVIFEAAGSTHVEVLELPPSVAPGGCFDHRGTTWQVTGTRTRQRVFIVRPTSA